MSRIEQFDQFIQDAMTSWSCPGVAISVLKGDSVMYEYVAGLRDVAANLPVTPDTRFPMASVTKSFTAMSAALLVDEGKLEWDKPVRDYLPDFRLSDAYATQHVTVRDMLSHRTGLPRHDLAAWRLDVPRAEFVKRMRHLTFNATFREKFQYNNLMYYATAYLVETIAQQPWETFVHDRIFAPLGMQASNFKPEPPLPDQSNAVGYRVDRDESGGAKDVLALPFGSHTELSPGAAGALFSTMADLTQWLKVHINEGRLGAVQLVSPTNLKQMHLPQTVIPGGGIQEVLMGNTIFTYGMGWFVEPYRGTTLVHHGGNVEGHSLLIGFVPREQVGVVVLTNIGMLPLRDVLFYEAIDRALDLPDRAWNTTFHTIFDPIIAGEASAKQTSREEQVADAPPTHSLDTYVGVYAADGYPDFAVRRVGDAFQARTVGSLDWSPLRHYHYDVFQWLWADFDLWTKVRFLTNDTGEIDAVSVPIEPAVANVVFKRKAPELTAELIDALVGEYDPPIEGITVTITAREGKIYAAQTGGVAEEIKAYTLTDDIVGFAKDRQRLDFVRENGRIARLILKAPGLTLEAPRNS